MLWWTRQQLKSSGADQRLKAIRSLASAKDRKAVPSLIKILPDENPHVRLAVIEALGSIGHPAAAEPLISALNHLHKKEKSDAAAECQAIAESLAGIGDPAVQPLIGALESGEKEERRWAAHALGMIRNPRAVDPLIGRLEDGRSEVRKAAALALGEIGDVRAAKSLIKSAASKDVETRRAAVEALGLMRSEEGLDTVTRAMEDSSEPVQIAAIHALAKIGGLSAAARLRSAMTGTRKNVCDAAEAALKNMSFAPSNTEERAEFALIRGDFEAALREGQAAAPALIRALQSKDPQLRAKAAEMLASLRLAESIQPLLLALRDHYAPVQESAARALAGIGPDARAGLEELLSYYDASAIRLAASALGDIGSADSVPPLLDFISANAAIPGEYPDLFDAVSSATEALGKLLAKSGAEISTAHLEKISALPETIRLVGLSPKDLDCSRLRSLAADELRLRGATRRLQEP